MWPRLGSASVLENLPTDIMATVEGHVRHERRNI